MEGVIDEAKKRYQFLRFTFADIHGIGRCKTVLKSGFEKFLRNGVEFHVGSLGYGLKGEIDSCDEITSKQMAAYYEASSNLTAVPVLDTLHPLKTIGNVKYQVGEILCETFYSRSKLRQEENPRYIARKQLDRLHSLGFEMYSSFEIEFMLVDIKTLKPVFSNNGEYNTSINQNRFDPILLDMATEVEATGVGVEKIHNEYSEGQFEMVLKPEVGIKIADNAFLAKNCIREVARKHDLKAIFMTKADFVESCNSLQFNHSLRKIEDGNNVHVFWDDDNCLKLSKECRWWLGGLIRHFRALNAICSPTFNCYRRLDRSRTPIDSGWGIDNRMEAFRVKNYSPEQTYIESRLPSGSANPYLILAVTVAAGIDGVANKMMCPSPRPPVTDNNFSNVERTKVPLNLAEALKALEEDGYMVDVLGKDFVKWFVLLKESEIKFLSGCDAKKDDLDMLARERDLYMDML